MAIKNLIFDVDGTLWDQSHLIAQSWNDAYKLDTGKDLGLDDVRIRQECGKTMKEIADSIYPESSEEYRLELMEHGMQLEDEYMEEKEANFYPRVYETLSRLQEKKIRLFIVSNAQAGYVELVIRKGNLQQIIEDHLQFGDTNEPKDKNIATIIRRNNLKLDETLYVGDIEKDNTAAHLAGIKMIFASYGYGEVLNPDYKICEFKELLELIPSI